ncbi:MAG: pyridoxal-phosphate dependent enzyme, partial [Myxococcota bacterium]
MTDNVPTREDVLAAAERIRGRVHNTPLMRCRAIDEATGCEVWLKTENLQKTGAFKARGASNAILSMGEDALRRGVSTHSSGNHGAALAYAAREAGASATVVMPLAAPAAKKRAVASYGARIVDCDNTLAAREATLADVVAKSGASVVHPYNDPRVIAGQGTAALEILQSLPRVNAIVAPVG